MWPLEEQAISCGGQNLGDEVTLVCVSHRDVKFGIQIGSVWLQIGQIWDFLRSVSVHFGSLSQNVLILILKRSRFMPLLGQSDPIWVPNFPSLPRARGCCQFSAKYA